jgi:hypothetical protein
MCNYYVPAKRSKLQYVQSYKQFIRQDIKVLLVQDGDALVCRNTSNGDSGSLCHSQKWR